MTTVGCCTALYIQSTVANATSGTSHSVVHMVCSGNVLGVFEAVTDFILSSCHMVQAAASKAKIKYKPLIDEEDERRRASAAAKLRALDEAIAKRRAEEER